MALRSFTTRDVSNSDPGAVGTSALSSTVRFMKRVKCCLSTLKHGTAGSKLIVSDEHCFVVQARVGRLGPGRSGVRKCAR